MGSAVFCLAVKLYRVILCLPIALTWLFTVKHEMFWFEYNFVIWYSDPDINFLLPFGLGQLPCWILNPSSMVRIRNGGKIFGTGFCWVRNTVLCVTEDRALLAMSSMFYYVAAVCCGTGADFLWSRSRSRNLMVAPVPLWKGITTYLKNTLT